MSFDIDDTVRLRVLFTDVNDAAVDPTEITIIHRDPNGVEVTEIYNGGAGNVVKAAVGDYHLLLTPAVSGKWAWRGEGTDTPNAQGEKIFYVRDQNVDA